MTNTQLYFRIGVPTFAVILAWLSTRSDINRLSDKVEGMTASLLMEMTALRTDLGKDRMRWRLHMAQLHERMAKLETDR